MDSKKIVLDIPLSSSSTPSIKNRRYKMSAGRGPSKHDLDKEPLTTDPDINSFDLTIFAAAKTPYLNIPDAARVSELIISAEVHHELMKVMKPKKRFRLSSPNPSSGKIWSAGFERCGQDAIEDSVRFDRFSKRYVVGTRVIKEAWCPYPIRNVDENSVSRDYYHVQKSLEIEVLKGVLAFRQKSGGGVVPPVQSRELFEFLQRTVLQFCDNDYPRPYIAAMILKLQNNFRCMLQAEDRCIPSLGHQDMQIYNLSNDLWGAQFLRRSNRDIQRTAVQESGEVVDEEEDELRESIAADIFNHVLFLKYYCVD